MIPDTPQARLRILAVAALFVFLSALLPAFIVAACNPPVARGETVAAETAEGRYLVKLRPGATVAVGAVEVGGGWVEVRGASKKDVESEFKGLAEVVEPVWIATTQRAPNDPQAPAQYALQRMNAHSAWDVTTGGGKTVVVVFDTGLDTSHPDLRGKYFGGSSYVNSRWDGDGHGHGTHVGGTIGAATGNAQGVAGVAWNTKISVAQVLAANGHGDTAGIVRGIYDAVRATPTDYRAVFNFSLGCECPSQAMAEAIAYATSKNILVVAAAGNFNADTARFYPANYDQVLSVAATDASDRKATFSNYNADIAAPGVNVLSTCRGGSYCPMSGTSMAAPNVAGVAALVRAAHPDWGVEQVRAALLNTARKPAWYEQRFYGAGIVDAGAAVRYGGAAPRPTPGPSPTPFPTPTANPSDNYSRQTETLINQYRTNLGLYGLRYDARLAAAARRHNEWMDSANCFAHTCPGEPDPFQRMRNAGYPLRGGSETIARGFETPAQVVNGWRDSPGHNAILTSRTMRDIGCDFLDGAGGHYMGLWWTCAYGVPSQGKDDGTLLEFSLPGSLEAGRQ